MAIESRYKLKTGEEVAYFPPIQNTDNPYLTEAAMYADQANQLQGYGYLVDGVGAFIYLGTVAGTAADYEAFMPTKDITLRSDNTSSTIYFYDSLTGDTLYAFIRYNAANNFLEFGSNDGQGDVVSAQIDRGQTDWEFKDKIQINKPGRGVWMHSPDNADYEIRTNDGGVLELWTLNGFGNLETLVWSSANGLDTVTQNASVYASADLDDVGAKNMHNTERIVKGTKTLTYNIQTGISDPFVVRFITDGGSIQFNEGTGVIIKSNSATNSVGNRSLAKLVKERGAEEFQLIVTPITTV